MGYEPRPDPPLAYRRRDKKENLLWVLLQTLVIVLAVRVVMLAFETPVIYIPYVDPELRELVGAIKNALRH